MANNNNDNAMDGIGENEEEDNQNGEGTKFTEEQLARKIKCRTKEGEIVEVFWHLLMQSKTFMNIWETMGGEEAFNDEMDEVDKDVFIFPVNEISTDCFGKIVEWLDEHKGQPEPVVEEDPATRERKWFNLTDWERNFLEVVDIETLAKYLAAANLLDLKSLYLYGCQEFARRLANKNPAQIREMLGIEDDLTEEEKEAIRARNLWCTY